jgi:hypothetical protein
MALPVLSAASLVASEVLWAALLVLAFVSWVAVWAVARPADINTTPSPQITTLSFFNMLYLLEK